MNFLCGSVCTVPDTQAVGRETRVACASPVWTITIGLKIIFRSDLIQVCINK